MNIPNVNVIILISSIFQFTKISSTNQPCSPLNKNSCPCSGFESYCQLETGYTFLNFPKSGSFIVKNIDYTNREIRLFDPERCLAEKMMFLNITSTPFQYKSKYNQYYMLYKCYVRNDDEIIINNRDVHVINCLSSKNYTVVSAPWNYSMPPCEAVNGGGGPVVLPVNYEHDDEPSSLVLTWSRNSQCIPQLACTDDFGLLSSTKSWIITATIAISLGLPGMFCVAWCLAKILVMRRSSTTTIAQAMATNNLNLQPSQTTIRLNVGSLGLDQPTLDSYPIMVIGESGRFLNLSNQEKICPICLVDYQINDRLKILPECLHKFHVECIDEWLLAKAMCPICRAMPPNFV